ncbi:MAG: PfkB family carbohydrate kinase [Candidatus Poribacteria bacterium]
MSIKRVTILEFAPTADEIWNLDHNKIDGYANYDIENGLVSILDTTHDAKPRPEILAVYAGGKATNVARVIDRLLDEKSDTKIELVTFLPPPQGIFCKLQPIKINDIEIIPSTPAGMYIQALQISDLVNVKPYFEILEELQGASGIQATRRCIEIIIKGTGTSLNFSPRIIWTPKTVYTVLKKLERIVSNTDMIVLAGSPPIWKSVDDQSISPRDFYAEILKIVPPKCDVSIDTRGYYLHKCLLSKKLPTFIFMNKNEFLEASESWKIADKGNFFGTVIVHNKDGCWVWDKNIPNADNLSNGSVFYPSPKVKRVYSTIGAGDAMHAGFLKKWIFSEDTEDRLAKSIIYSQAVSAVSVSNEKATYGIDAGIVKQIFEKIYH